MARLAFLHRSFVLPRYVHTHRVLSSLRPHCSHHVQLNPSRRPISACSQQPPSATAQSNSSFPDVLHEQPHQALPNSDTIFALATAPAAAAGVAIIRISGPSALQALTALLRSPDAPPAPRRAALRALHDPTTNDLLDRALVLYFAPPASFTGEPVVELHLHGSRAVVSAVSDALLDLSTDLRVRPAERGEFSRRAFENGRMDLTEAEGLADLIAAETPAQRRQALRHMSGHARAVLDGWRADIKACLAHVEAVIDFSEDVDDEVLDAVIPRVVALRDAIVARLADDRRGEIIRDGASVAIVGPPNAGKSTLLNALARRPAAIVSPIAGTTRDIVEVRMDIAGWPVVVADTAGLRETTEDPVEQEGMRRARRAARSADIVVLMYDAEDTAPDAVARVLPERLQMLRENESAEERDGLDDNEWQERSEPSVICVVNKMDLIKSPSVDESVTFDGVPLVHTSLKYEQGVDAVVVRLETELKRKLQNAETSEGTGWNSDTAPLVTRARHRHHLRSTVASLTAFVDGRSPADEALRTPLDLSAEDLRIATKELGAITGVIQTEEVLDLIFSEFCIGK